MHINTYKRTLRHAHTKKKTRSPHFLHTKPFMQGIENGELGHVPARQTTLLHGGARKADGGSMARTLTQIRCYSKPTAWSSTRQWTLSSSHHQY